MVQNKEIEEQTLTNGENGDVKVKEENGVNGGDVSDYEESDDDDYLDHLLMVPPIDRDVSDRNKNLVSKTLLDFCTAIESRKEYQKIRQELLINCVPPEEEVKTEPEEETKPILCVTEEPEVPLAAPTESNEVTEVPELRRQSIRLRKAQFVPEHAPAIHDQFFVCRRCTIFFRTRKLRKLHNLEHHRRKVNGEPKQRMRRSSTNKEPFICDLCEKIFKQKALLRSHVNSHMTEPQFFCSLCPYASKRNPDLKKHHEMHHNPERIVKKRVRKRKCEQCEEILSGKKAMKLHVKEKHPPEHPVKKARNFQKICEKCEEVLEGMKAYRLHMKHKHKEPPCEIRCETCHRRFKTNFRLKKHKLKYSEAGIDCRNYFRPNGGATESHDCPHCEKKFPLKSHLTLHMKKHTSLTCLKCNQTFKNKFNLKWHEFSHLEIEPKCANCSIGFKSEQKFAVHLKKKICAGSVNVSIPAIQVNGTVE